MRIFIAFQLPQNIKEELRRQSSALAKDFPIKTVAKNNLHLTLAFLGEVNQERLNKVYSAVETTTKKFRPIKLTTAGFGCFPNFKLPKVLWLGLAGETATLTALDNKLSTELKKAGFQLEEEKFVPHITFGRLKSYANKTIQRRLGERIQHLLRLGNDKIGHIPIVINSLIVFQSIPTSAGHVHKILKTYRLG